MSNKTEQPSAQQLRKARRQGDVPVSAALAQAVAFVAVLCLLPTAARACFAATAELSISAVHGRTLSAREMCAVILALTLPVVGVAATVSGALCFVQTGGLIAWERVQPKLERLDPWGGLRSLMSPTRLLGVIRALLGALLVGIAVVLVLRKVLPSLAATPGELGPSMALAASSALQLAWYSAAVGLVLAAVDVVMNRQAWLKRWMMSRDELQREHKENEGDPELKASRKRAHQEMLASAALHAVKDATVVIVNPTHLATALRYREEEDVAPLVLAQGQGDLAHRIVQAAHAYGVPVVQDVPIARLLQELEVGQEIPEGLYEAVAEILREVWRAEEEARPALTP